MTDFHRNLLKYTQLALFGFLAINSLAETPQDPTAIEEYVRAADDSYSWSVHSTLEQDGVQHVVIDLISQTWLTELDVDRTKWQHWLIVTIPPQVESPTGLLYIGGGNNQQTEPNPNPTMTQIALATNTIVAELGMVPNQPLTFKTDPTARPRYEDDLIGYAWQRYFKTDEPRWLPRGAMVKSAVRAMDTITKFTQAEARTAIPEVNQFVVAGGSKRGWTAWLTAAMDDRVVAVAPIVIDVVNIRPSMAHHFAAYGFWAPAIGNYVEHQIMTAWENPKLEEIYKLVDPYFYLDRISIPKLVLNASGDQFFLPDSSRFYWEKLIGPKYLRYVPNANHSLSDTNGTETLAAFHALVVKGEALPEYSWSVSESGDLSVQTATNPNEVLLWQATNPVARDFRVESIGRAYESTPLTPDENGTYTAAVEPPETGWTAYFIELTWELGLPVPLRLSTEVIVRPELLPFADKALNLTNSITLICQMQTAEKSAEMAKVVEELTDTSFAKEGIQTQLWGNRIYINWTPADEFQRGFFEMAALLEESGCEARAYQFESGPDITVPPVKPLN